MTEIKIGDRVRHELMGEGTVGESYWNHALRFLVDFDNGIQSWVLHSKLTLIEPEPPELGFEVGDTVEASGVRAKVERIDLFSDRSANFTDTRGISWIHYHDPSARWHFTKVSRPTTFTVSKEISVEEYEEHLMRRDHLAWPATGCKLAVPTAAEVDAAYREQVGE